MSSSSPLLSTEAHARVGCLPVSVCILHSFCRSRIARGIFIFHLSGPCSRGCRAAWADAPSRGCSGISRLSTVWPLPVLLRAAREHAPFVGRGCRVWWRWLRMRLRGFLVFGAWRCLPGLRVCACLYSTCLVRGLCRRVLLRVYAALFVGCVLLCRMLLVCCGLFCLSAIVWCAFRERAFVWCDVVHAGWCGRAFDCDRGCRLLFTV